jgi:hypothetical protein
MENGIVGNCIIWGTMAYKFIIGYLKCFFLVVEWRYNGDTMGYNV